MSDDAPRPNSPLVERFVALVALVTDQPAAAMEHRDAARAVVEAARGGAVTFALDDGAITANGAPIEAALLAKRFAAYGLEALGITEKASQADLLDLARLLATEPGVGDPPARFAARATVLDSKALPRRLKPRADAPPPAPLMPAPPQRRPSGSAPRQPTPPLGAPTKRTPSMTPSIGSAPIAEPPSIPDRPVAPLPIPTPSRPELAAALDALDLASSAVMLAAALDQLIVTCDLAFRQGRDDDLIEGLTALVGVEVQHLARSGADEVRQAFNHTVRRLAKPVMLRRLAGLRHQRAGDDVASARLQQALVRFGTDGAEALVDEFTCATTAAARAVCLSALREHRRTHDVLHAHVRDQRELVVRQAATLLGELADARSEPTLIELVQHPEFRVRRAAVSALCRLGTDAAIDAATNSLNDESSLVRQRAVAILAARRDPRRLASFEALVEREADREVLYAAIAAIGAIGTPEAVQVLTRVAAGEGANAHRRSAGMRIQGCLALVAIRTPTAMAAVQGLREDRDREVREAALRLVAQAARRSTSAIAAVPG